MVLWQYMDDLLAWLVRVSSPLWASLVVLLFLILGIPMSWHKAALAVEVDWIGWRISVATWSISVPPEKLQRIIDQLETISKGSKPSAKDFQSLISLSAYPGSLRRGTTLLILLYRALHRIPTTMVGMDHVTFQTSVSALSPH